MNEPQLRVENPPPQSPRGPLIIISGPSGSGKSTLIERLAKEIDSRYYPLYLAISATTRPPRAGEVDGSDYYFLTRDGFEKELRDGAFIEWAQVHGHYYGTLKREVDPYLSKGQGVILDIDVQGAAQVRRQYPDQVSIFLRATSESIYEDRLRKRGTEDEAGIQRRLETGRQELACAPAYDYRVTNDNFEAAVAELRAIIEREFQGRKHAG